MRNDVVEPNWPEINRVISDSINGPFDYSKYCGRCGWTLSADNCGCTKELCSFIGFEGKRADEPRDWRTGTGPLELLKRMPRPRLEYFRDEGVWGCVSDWMTEMPSNTSYDHGPEEAIMLAYYATVKETKR